MDSRKSALILIANGSEEIEFVTPYDVLTRAGVDVRSVGVLPPGDTVATCSRNVRIVADIANVAELTDFDIAATDLLVIPGGGPGAEAMAASKDVRRLVRRLRDDGKPIGCICAATTVVVASVEQDLDEPSGAASRSKVNVTSHPAVKKAVQSAGWNHTGERVVVDGGVISSVGPGSSLLFALTLVEVLLGKAKRDEVAGLMLAAEL